MSEGLFIGEKVQNGQNDEDHPCESQESPKRNP